MNRYTKKHLLEFQQLLEQKERKQFYTNIFVSLFILSILLSFISYFLFPNHLLLNAIDNIIIIFCLIALLFNFSDFFAELEGK